MGCGCNKGKANQPSSQTQGAARTNSSGGGNTSSLSHGPWQVVHPNGTTTYHDSERAARAVNARKGGRGLVTKTKR